MLNSHPESQKSAKAVNTYTYRRFPLRPISDRLFDEKRLYQEIETYALQHHLIQAMAALPYATELHKHQTRRGVEKVPYIYHPLLVARHAIALGLDRDELVCAALLHDVCEDCYVSPDELPFNPEVQETVRLLTRDFSERGRSDAGKEAYYSRISQNAPATLIKLLDRCNNISSMVTAFTPNRMQKYIEETEIFVYPLFEAGEERFPEYQEQLFIIRYHMSSVIDSLKRLLSRNMTDSYYYDKKGATV